MKKVLLVFVTVLAFNLSNAQETFKNKQFGIETVWSFDGNELTITSSGNVMKQKIEKLGVVGKMTIYQNTESFMGVKAKYQLTHKKKDKYVLLITVVDELTGVASNGIYNVKKI